MKYYILDEKNNLLLLKSAEGDYSIPNILPEGINVPNEDLVFDMKEKTGEDGIAFLLPLSVELQDSFELKNLRETYDFLSYEEYEYACRASAWIYWERTNRFCPICGSKLKRHMDMGKKCEKCGAEHFPHLAPAAIIRVTRKSDPSLEKDDEILLVRARNFRRPNMYGLVAGFLEGGETLEECAMRELKEEVGIAIKNIKYFGSQPWPYPSGVMVGFTAEYESGEIKMDDGELVDARFFKKEELPQIPNKMSIARRLIDDWIFS